MSKLPSHIGLAIRRAVARLAVGESVEINTEHASTRSISGAVQGAMRRQRKNCVFTHAEGKLTITLVDDAPPAQRNQYGFETMQPGEVRKLAMPETEHHKVRLAAHACAAKNGWRLSCNKTGPDEIVVTRVEEVKEVFVPTAAHAFAMPGREVVAAKRRSMYPFDDLQEIGASFFVPITAEPNGGNLRVHAIYHGKRLGAVFRVSYSGDSLPPTQRGHTITRIE